jgi:hypothetical protein
MRGIKGILECERLPENAHRTSAMLLLNRSTCPNAAVWVVRAVHSTVVMQLPPTTLCVSTEFMVVKVRGSEHPRGMALVTRVAALQAEEQRRGIQWHTRV